MPVGPNNAVANGTRMNVHLIGYICARLVTVRHSEAQVIVGVQLRHVVAQVHGRPAQPPAIVRDQHTVPQINLGPYEFKAETGAVVKLCSTGEGNMRRVCLAVQAAVEHRRPCTQSVQRVTLAVLIWRGRGRVDTIFLCTDSRWWVLVAGPAVQRYKCRARTVKTAFEAGCSVEASNTVTWLLPGKHDGQYPAAYRRKVCRLPRYTSVQHSGSEKQILIDLMPACRTLFSTAKVRNRSESTTTAGPLHKVQRENWQVSNGGLLTIDVAGPSEADAGGIAAAVVVGLSIVALCEQQTDALRSVRIPQFMLGRTLCCIKWPLLAAARRQALACGTDADCTR